MSSRARKRINTVVSKVAAYDTILRPIITEKATMANENGQITFAVSIDATKPQIKAAVEMLFNVKVKAVNTIIQKGKAKAFRGRPGRQLRNPSRGPVAHRRPHRSPGRAAR